VNEEKFQRRARLALELCVPPPVWDAAAKAKGAAVRGPGFHVPGVRHCGEVTRKVAISIGEGDELHDQGVRREQWADRCEGG
jgi:hypothetical protein